MRKDPKLKAVAQTAANAVPAASLAVATAIKALSQGKANEHQQKLALEWIVRQAGGKGSSFPYHPSDRDTAFALGRYFVADLIAGLINADLSSLRQAEEG